LIIETTWKKISSGWILLGAKVSTYGNAVDKTMPVNQTTSSTQTWLEL